MLVARLALAEIHSTRGKIAGYAAARSIDVYEAVEPFGVDVRLHNVNHSHVFLSAGCSSVVLDDLHPQSQPSGPLQASGVLHPFMALRIGTKKPGLYGMPQTNGTTSCHVSQSSFRPWSPRLIVSARVNIRHGARSPVCSFTAVFQLRRQC